MDLETARAVLGVTEGTGAGELRRAYRRLLLRTHPDVSPEADSTARTARLTTAYDVLNRSGSLGAVPPPATGAATAPPPHRPGRGGPRTEARRPTDGGPEQRTPGSDDDGGRPLPSPPRVGVVDGDSFVVEAPRGETLLALVDAAHELGEITYLDAAAGLVEIMVEIVDGPTCQVLLTMQGRATEGTEVSCSVESYGPQPPPPLDALTRLVAATVADGASG